MCGDREAPRWTAEREIQGCLFLFTLDVDSIGDG